MSFWHPPRATLRDTRSSRSGRPPTPYAVGNGVVWPAHELAAERPDAAVPVAEGTDHSLSESDYEDETTETTLESIALPVGER